MHCGEKGGEICLVGSLSLGVVELGGKGMVCLPFSVILTVGVGGRLICDCLITHGKGERRRGKGLPKAEKTKSP